MKYQMNKEVVQGLQKQSDGGKIELDIHGDCFNFQWAELAPPSGVVAANYSRHFLNSFLPFIIYLHNSIDIFIMKQTNLTSLQLHGQFLEHWLKIKEAISIMLNMGSGLREVMTHLLSGTLRTSMELVFKAIF